MKKLLILMLLILSPSFAGAMQGGKNIFDTFNGAIKDIDIVKNFKTVGFANFNRALIELLSTMPEHGIFIVPLASQLAKIAYAYSNQPAGADRAAKRFSYEVLRQFRQETIDLLKNANFSWPPFPKSFFNSAQLLVNLIEPLQFPEKTWGNWAKSWVIEAGEDYRQWAKSDVPNKLVPLIDQVRKFAADEQTYDSEVRAIACVYTLYLQLLKSMLEEYFDFKGPLLSGQQKAALCVGGACVGYAAYKTGKWMGSATPAAGQ